MRINKYLSLIIVVCLFATSAVAQKKKNKKRKESNVTSLKLYPGPELPETQVVRLSAVTEGKKYAYFIDVDGEDVPNRSLVTGPQEILIMPGEHRIQMRFVAKGEIAIPIEPFDNFSYETGKSYIVKFEYFPGKGSYIDGASSTRIRLWIEEVGRQDILIEKVVDGFGRSIK